MLLNLLQLLQSDDQTTFTDKVNYNFDQILAMGGGPIGPTGFVGLQGVPGAQGIIGFQGLPGQDGSRWYVQPSTSTPVIPVPKLGDFWLQTDTQAIFEFLGSPPIWTNLGITLTSSGVFKLGGTNDIMFTLTDNFRNLVLSPIAYPGDSVVIPDFKLKVVGDSGSPALRFAIAETSTTENAVNTQPSIGLQKTNDGSYISRGGINWNWIFSGIGDMTLSNDGNFFKVIPQKTIGGQLEFQFNTQTKIQASASDRLLSFATGVTGEQFHIGRHGAITNLADRMLTINDAGDFSFWSKSNTKSNTNQYLSIEPGGISGAILYPNNHIRISSKDTGNYRNIIFNYETDSSSIGSGFIGIGKFFGEDVSTGSLIVGRYYAGKTSSVTHNLVTYPTGVPFQAINSAYVSSGVVTLANPTTKFHVNGAVTFGTRSIISTYSTDVGNNSFTLGNNHSASGLRSIILGGIGHTTSGTDGIIIGYSSGNPVNMPDSNTVLLATDTHVSKHAPTTKSFLNAINFDSTQSPFSFSTNPILNISADGTFIPGQLNIIRALTVEGNSVSGGVFDFPSVSIDFLYKNTVAEGHLSSITTLNYGQQSQISFLTRFNPSSTSGPSLVIGKTYMVLLYNPVDDFKNVSNTGILANQKLAEFVATGTTPNNWTGASILIEIAMKEALKLGYYNSLTGTGGIVFNGEIPNTIQVGTPSTANTTGKTLSIVAATGTGTGLGGNLQLFEGASNTAGLNGKIVVGRNSTFFKRHLIGSLGVGNITPTIITPIGNVSAAAGWNLGVSYGFIGTGVDGGTEGYTLFKVGIFPFWNPAKISVVCSITNSGTNANKFHVSVNALATDSITFLVTYRGGVSWPGHVGVNFIAYELI